MAHTEPFNSTRLLGSNIAFQRASARHYPLQRNCRGGIMLRVDRLHCKAVRQWQAGTKALQTSQR